MGLSSCSFSPFRSDETFKEPMLLVDDPAYTHAGYSNTLTLLDKKIQAHLSSERSHCMARNCL